MKFQRVIVIAALAAGCGGEPGAGSRSEALDIDWPDVPVHPGDSPRTEIPALRELVEAENRARDDYLARSRAARVPDWRYSRRWPRLDRADAGYGVGVQGLAPETPQAEPVFERVHLGTGRDAVTGEPMKLCIDPSTVQEHSQAIRASASSVKLVRNDSELKSYVQRELNTEGSVTLSAFSGKHSAAYRGINESITSMNTVRIMAKYDWVLGERWITGPVGGESGAMRLFPRLQGAIDGDAADGFRAECGDAYVGGVEEGASLLIVYSLTQKRESTSTTEELKAAVEAKYGLIGGSIGGSITDRQAAVLSSYELESHCYVLGGDADACRFIRDEQGVWGALDRLSTDIEQSPEKIVAIRTRLVPYSRIHGRSELNTFEPFVRKLKAWEPHLAAIDDACIALPFLANDCEAARADVRTEVERCLARDPECREPSSRDHAGLISRRDLGSAFLFYDENFTGQSMEINFSVERRLDRFRPGIYYSLHRRGFGDELNSFFLDATLDEHWILELYEHETGQGQVVSSLDMGLIRPSVFGWPSVDAPVRGHANVEDLTPDFEDAASAFRLLPKAL